jgi:hypothetical protein
MTHARDEFENTKTIFAVKINPDAISQSKVTKRILERNRRLQQAHQLRIHLFLHLTPLYGF